jgi:hypothetical protein
MNLFNRSLLIAATLAALTMRASSQSRMLDTFDPLAGWKAVPSEGASVHIVSVPGKTGDAMEMEFDLSKASGYVIARKKMSIDLPADYQFVFDLRGETPVNNFEFKIIDDNENVFWIKKLNITYPTSWTTQHIWKHQLTFAWGPTHPATITHVSAVEFVVSCGTGGKGRVLVDNFRLESIDEAAAGAVRTEVVASSSASGSQPIVDPAGTEMSAWQSSGASSKESLTFSFNRFRAVGGLVIDWDTAGYGTTYDVLFSDDGKDWSTSYSVRQGNGGRDYVPLFEGQGKYLRLNLLAGTGNTYRIRSIHLKDASFSQSPNALYKTIAAEARPGLYPKYFLNKQSYWTVMGANGDTKESLINEQGTIEVDKQQFSLEPFLWINGKLVTWSDVSTECSLDEGYLPIPTVRWVYGNECTVAIEAFVGGQPGSSILCVRYTIVSQQPGRQIRFFVAIRPFQVNPPWQSLNFDGGVARIDSIVNNRGMIEVDGRKVIPLTNPSAFGAVEFDRGDITDFLSKGTVPPDQRVNDHTGRASAALRYDIPGEPDRPYEVVVAYPLHSWRSNPVPNMGRGASLYYGLVRSEVVGTWERIVNRFSLTLPSSAQDVVNTLKSQFAYILINRDGPGTQPGSRTYERSWIRDGSLTCYALLQAGHLEEVRQYLDWYATFQFPSGKIPCVVDSRGGDVVNEHDSNGEFIYAVYQDYLFTRDSTWLRGKFPIISNAIAYLDSLRSLRMTSEYLHGTPAQRALYGLVPESISHEGYFDVPRHSYWDDFFVLRAYKDATAIAAVLGETHSAEMWGRSRDEFRKDLYASMRQAMKNTGVQYIPGCAELGDFDATSTTIGISPGGELGNIPEPALHNTFDKYFEYFTRRLTDTSIVDYTPYETRVIGSFVMLGEKERAAEAMNFFMKDRRPPAWNEWAEVVWRNPETPKYIGDMPHTWVGSDFVRSVFSMFEYVREKDNAIVLAAGIPDGWILDTSGVKVTALFTPAGRVNYTLISNQGTVIADVGAGLDTKRYRVVMSSPLSKKLLRVRLNGRNVTPSKNGEVVIHTLPARLEFVYRR